MAHHESAKKRIRQTVRQTAINHARKSRIRTFMRKLDEAIAGGDKKAAQEAFRQAQPEMMRGVTKGVLHRNTVSRRLSRLSARIRAL
jgi:small subunit ribosomal protein S20